MIFAIVVVITIVSLIGCFCIKESGIRAMVHFFDVANDGGAVEADSWQVTWSESCVEAIISGEEQRDNQYILYFDGKTDYIQLDAPTGEWK